MKIPNAATAVIAEDKLVKYLLNDEHPKGGGKARLFLALGYEAGNWQRFASDIREQHLSQEVVASAENDYGVCYEIVAPLKGPAGRSMAFRSVWQIDTGTHTPRLITMVPE